MMIPVVSAAQLFEVETLTCFLTSLNRRSYE